MITTALYARSDLCAINIPSASGGCGRNGGHTRPVIKGAPVKVWKLECPQCESVLKGDRKQKILRYHVNPQTGQAVRQERIPDSDDRWSSTPDTIPLTPDEERTNKTRSERGSMQIQMLQALAAIRATGVQVPAEAMWLLEREIPAGVLQGTVLCANNHDVPAGLKYCGECGISMAARGAIDAAPESAPVIPLDSLHVATLRKMCRERKLPDNGSKEALIGRIMAA